MNSSIHFRKATGLNQHDFSDWLGISRDLLAQVEAGKRSFQTQSLIRLSQYKQLLENLEPGEPMEESPIFFPKKEKSLLQKVQKLTLETDRLNRQIQDLESKMAVWKTALNLCPKLKSEAWLQSDAQLLDAIDRFHQKTWIAWCEHGPRELQRLKFYLNQKLEERAFLEKLAADYGTGAF